MNVPGNGGQEKEPWRSIFEAEATGKYLFHYTRLAPAIESILPDLRLRFSRFSSMRNPRESKWAFSGTGFLGEEERDDNDAFWELWAALDRVRQDVRILSLTADNEESFHPWGRGYARPRLWEQYAGNHLGVCLCFERSALVQAVEAALRELGLPLFQAMVTYKDDRIGTAASNFDLGAARERDPDEVISDHVERHTDELFFTKLTDWRSEWEYRFITRWRSPRELFVEICGALKVVLLGHAVAQNMAQASTHCASRLTSGWPRWNG